MFSTVRSARDLPVLVLCVASRCSQAMILATPVSILRLRDNAAAVDSVAVKDLFSELVSAGVAVPLLSPDCWGLCQRLPLAAVLDRL